MTAPQEITLVWSERDHALRLASPAPDGRAPLDPVVGQGILERASLARRSDPLRITVLVPPGASVDALEVSAMLHAHFRRRRETAEYRLRRKLRAGWTSLAIAATLLVVLMSLGEAIHRLAPAGRLATVLQEGLTIVAWVALWRPVELLLYDQWTLRRDIALLRRLEDVDVQLVTEPLTHATS